jgi:alpha-mannosidase
MKKVFCVISHTHWDREWYASFEVFRIKLADLIDNLLEILEREDNFRFHLDAQTIVLEDYLVIKPQNADKLKKYIAQGRVLVGPWYVQNDFYLTSGEATVRNFIIGHQIAEEFGQCTMVGYAPDQFGIISQFPQILQKFGMDTCLFGRGFNFDELREAEFIWKGEDGSQVLAVHMPFWYNNAQRFSKDIDKAMKMVKLNRERLQITSTTPYYLMMNGVDHLEAQEDLMPILMEINKRLPEGESIIQTTMPEYMENVKASVNDLNEYIGEMRNGNEYNILAGTLSSRVYLKQWNTRCQALLEHRLEPLYSLLQMVGIQEYPKDFLAYLWKVLLQNHAHDSICGCSVDRVHEHMVDRFKRVEEAGEELLIRGMEFLTSYIDREQLSDHQYIIGLCNTGQRQRSGVEEVILDFLEEEAPEEFCINDSLGNEVPYVILEKRNKMKSVLSPINLPGVVSVVSYRVKMWVDKVPGLGYKTYFVTPGKKGKLLAQKSSSIISAMENEYLKVEIQSNGSINLLEKESGKWYHNLLMLEDREDTGDSYIYRNNPKCAPILSTSVEANIIKVEENDLNSIRLVSYELPLPMAYCFEAGKRSSEVIGVPIDITLVLKKGSRQLDVSIDVHNKVKDHRLRILFPTGIDTDITMAGSPFDVVARDKTLISKGIIKVAEQPNTNFVNVDGQGYGIAVLNEGLYEYEHLRDSENTIALTLLRGNGFISSDETGLPMEDRWLVPDNQCLGVHTLNISIYPHKGNYLEGEVPQKAQDFLNPLLVYCQPVDTRKFTGGRPFVQDSDVAEIFFRDKKYPDIKLPRSLQVVSIKGKDVVLSCVKQKEKGDSLILRLFNPSSASSSFSITLFQPYHKAFMVNLNEEKQQEVRLTDQRTINLLMAPKEIITLELVPFSRG